MDRQISFLAIAPFTGRWPLGLCIGIVWHFVELLREVHVTLISVFFHPRVTTVAHKRPQSVCQKCRWQVTAKYACSLRMWLCMKWHGVWLYGVHGTCTERAAVSCGTSHAGAVSTPLQWIFRNALYKASHSSRITCECNEPAWERRIALYKSNQQQRQQQRSFLNSNLWSNYCIWRMLFGFLWSLWYM